MSSNNWRCVACDTYNEPQFDICMVCTSRRVGNARHIAIPRTGSTLTLIGDTVHRQWTVAETTSALVTLARDDGYTQVLTLLELAARRYTPDAPTYFLDQHGDVWESTLDGRYRRYQITDRMWGPIEDAAWAKEALELTALT